MEFQNPKYFEAYQLRLLIKSQIEFYNDVNYLLKEPLKIQDAVASLISNFNEIEKSPSSEKSPFQKKIVQNN